MNKWIGQKLKDEILKWSEKDWKEVIDLLLAEKERQAHDLIRLLLSEGDDGLEKYAELLFERARVIVKFRPNISREDFCNPLVH